MRTTITSNQSGYVTVSYDDDGVRVERTFSCPAGGGYVREHTNGVSQQVCNRLARRGSTLTCNDGTKLANVIRREYRAMRRTDHYRYTDADKAAVDEADRAYQ